MAPRAGTRLWIRTRRGYHVLIDTARQSLELSSFGARGLRPAPASLRELPASDRSGRGLAFVSAGVLAMKSLQFDAGLMVTLRLAAEHGLGSLPARKVLLTQLARVALRAARTDAPPPGARRVAVRLAVALGLRGTPVAVPASLRRRVKRWSHRVASQPGLRVVTGPWGWTRQLAQMVRSRSVLVESLAPVEARFLLRRLRKDARLRKAYLAQLALEAKLMDRPALPTLGAYLGREMSQADAVWPLGSRAVLFSRPRIAYRGPLGAVRAVVKREGMTLKAARTIRALAQRGALRFPLTPGAGWLARRIFSLAPLLTPERMPEGRKIGWWHRVELLRLWEAWMASVYQTSYWSGAPRSSFLRGKHVVEIPPTLTLDPVPTHYLRQAETYRFLQDQLRGILGTRAFLRLRRRTPTGVARESLDAELRFMTSLYYGAYLESSREIGLVTQSRVALQDGRRDRYARRLFRRWSHTLLDDPDLGRDLRTLVVLPAARRARRIAVHAICGVRRVFLRVQFSRYPKVLAVHDPKGRPLPLSSVKIRFLPYRDVVYLNISSVNARVRRLISDAAFRRRIGRTGGCWTVLSRL